VKEILSCDVAVFSLAPERFFVCMNAFVAERKANYLN
jgi:hypothetical protein